MNWSLIIIIKIYSKCKNIFRFDFNAQILGKERYKIFILKVFILLLWYNFTVNLIFINTYFY